MESNEQDCKKPIKNHVDAAQTNSSMSSRSPTSSLSSSPISVASSLPSIVDTLMNKTNKSPVIDNNTTSKSTIGKRKFFKVVDDETDSSLNEPSTNGEEFLKKKNLLNCDNNNSNDSNNNSNSGRTIKNDTDKDKDTQNNTTVKDLENAMSKHLPKKSSDIINLPQTTDFSTDALLKQQDRATIQWIGAHHHHHHNHHQHNSSTNTASVLLRQLYANRESVIRANVQGNYTNAANIRSVVPTTGASPYFVNDQHGPLPTPPDSDAATFNENQFVLHHHHHHHQKSLAAAANDTFNALISYSTPSTYAAAAAVAAAADYHSAMTPPSSVSPREKYQLLHNNMTPIDNSVYNDVLRHPYFSNSNPNNVATSTNAVIENSPTLPLKSQLYTTSGVHSNAFDAATAAAVCAAAGSIEQSQFYHHNTTRSSFHHFYKSNTSTSNWYSP